MTPRERAEATAAQIVEMLKDAWDVHNARESDGINVADMIDAFATEHARALRALLIEISWLRRLLGWCSHRMRGKGYEDALKRYLAAGPQPEPKDEPPVIAAVLRRKALGE